MQAVSSTMTQFVACEEPDRHDSLKAQWLPGAQALKSKLHYSLGHEYNDHLAYVTHLRLLVKQSDGRVAVDRSIQICGPGAASFAACSQQLLERGRISGALDLDVPYDPKALAVVQVEEVEPFTVLYKLCSTSAA